MGAWITVMRISGPGIGTGLGLRFLRGLGLGLGRLFVLSALAVLLTGCGNSESRETGDPIGAGGAEASPAPNFRALAAEEIGSVVLTRGDGSGAVRLESPEEISEAAAYFGSAEPAKGAATADLNGYVRFRFADGTALSLEITGTATVFKDESTGAMYGIRVREPAFSKWLEARLSGNGS